MSVLILIMVLFSGCIVGDVVALPFRITGDVVKIIAPDIVGETIYTNWDTNDLAIPF